LRKSAIGLIVGMVVTFARSFFNIQIISCYAYESKGICAVTVADKFSDVLDFVLCLPFDMKLRYNQETLDAMQEARDIMSGKIQAEAYNSVDEMSADLGADCKTEDESC
jgi:DNA-damage-inducible protein J